MRTDPRPTRQQDSRADYLLVQLTELAHRRARVADVAPDLRTKLAELLSLIPTIPQYPTASAVVHGATDRLQDAWGRDALRLIAKRDVEVVRSFLATTRVAA
jgi:hypothetical protein